MFGMHPRVLFNDGGAGHGVSLVQNHKMGEARVRVREWEYLRHYTVINLRWLCIWTKAITIWDEGLQLHPGSEWKLWKREADGHAVGKQTQMRRDEVTEVRGEDLKCSKHLASLPQCTRQAGFMCGFSYVTWRAIQHVLWLSTPWHNLSQEHVLTFAQASPHSLCFLLHWFNLLANLFFSLAHQQPIYSHPLPVHLSPTRGQVCPCVASSNRKCIMDVTFLSISTTKSHTALCFEW